MDPFLVVNEDVVPYSLLDRQMAVALLEGKERIELVYLAKLAELSGRYDELCAAITMALAQGPLSSEEELRLLEHGFKSAAKSRRTGLDKLASLGSAPQAVRESLERELSTVSTNAISAAEKELDSDFCRSRPEALGTLYLMAADHYRYLRNSGSAMNFYNKAAALEIGANSPVHLRALCGAAILEAQAGNKSEALKISQRALDASKSASGPTSHEAQILLKLLGDHSAEWTTTLEQQVEAF